MENWKRGRTAETFPVAKRIGSFYELNFNENPVAEPLNSHWLVLDLQLRRRIGSNKEHL